MPRSIVWIIEDETQLPAISDHIRGFPDLVNQVISLSSVRLSLAPSSDQPIRLLRHILQHDTRVLPLKNIAKFWDFIEREYAITIIVGHIASAYASACLHSLLADSPIPCLYVEGNMPDMSYPQPYWSTWQFLYTNKSQVLANMALYPHNEHHLFTYQNAHFPDESQQIEIIANTSIFDSISMVYIINPEKIEGLISRNSGHHGYICFFDSSCKIEHISLAITHAERHGNPIYRFILSDEQSGALKPTMAYPHIYILNSNLLYYLHSCDQLLLVDNTIATLQIHRGHDPKRHQIQYIEQEVGCHMTWRDTSTMRP
jgi:hypothetical protein